MINALIVVDVQNDFCENGALAVPGGNSVAERLTDYIANKGKKFDFIIATQDWHKPGSDNGGHISADPDFVDSWPAHCIAGTDGARINPRLILPNRTIFFKKGYGSPSYSGFDGQFLNSSLGTFLLGVAGPAQVNVEIVGLATDYCVKATAIDSASLGFKTKVRLAYCSAISYKSLREALAEMEEAGVEFV